MAPQITIKSEDGLISTYTLIKPDNNIYIKNASYPEYVMSFGSTCVVYLAKTSNGRKRLIKEFLEKHDTTHEHSILNEIINCHSNAGKNYFSQDDFFGEDEMGKNYHVFPAFEGDIIRPYVVSNEEEFIAVLREYKRFLCHLEDVHKSFLHWDIKASNVFRFASHDDSLGEYIWELIDFDVSCKIDDTSVYGHGTCRPTSPEWYTDKDLIAYNKLTSDQLAEHRFVLDITAAAKLLSYSICGYTQYRRTEFITSHEGYCTALARIFRKAFHRDLTQRYKSATELKDDVLAMINSREAIQEGEFFSSALSYNIHEMNCSPLKSTYKANSLYVVKNNKIDTEILTDIKCDELRPEPFSFDEDKGSALEQLLDATNKHIWLVGDAGGGKSTATDYLYLESLRKHFTDVAIVYTKLSDCKFGEDYSTIELSKIADTSKLDKLNSPVIILLDGYDETKRRRALGSQQEQEKFDTAFVKAIEKKSNFRFVISSRFLPEVVRESETFISATNQSLRDKNIYEYLQIDHDGINRINKNQALLKLLRNPFCLTLFSALKAENANIAYEITMESDLIEKYLWSTYKSKAGDAQSRIVFDVAIGEISAIALDDQYVDVRTYTTVASFIHIFNNYIDLKQIEKNKYEVFFAHELIREWFVAHQLKFILTKMSSDVHIDEKNLLLFGSNYSYTTLLLLAQILFPNNEVEKNELTKTMLENEYQRLLSMAKSVMWETGVGGTIQNIIRVVAFAFNGELDKFNFGNEDWFIPEDTFNRCEKLYRITIPSHFKHIGKNAFCLCQNLYDIVLEPGIQTIGEGAFCWCDNIVEIIIPDTVYRIGVYQHEDPYEDKAHGAFEGCDNLECVVLSKNLKVIGNHTFENCEKLTGINIPDTVTNIGEHAFSYTGLRKVILPISLTEISEWCFGDCDLECVTIPEGVISIGNFAFSDCPKLTYVNLPSMLKYIGLYAFGSSGLKEITIPAHVTKIEWDAFEHCFDIEKISVDKENLTYQSEGNCLINRETQTLIRGCKNSIIPPKGCVKYILDGAFSACLGLEEIEIPEGVIEIDPYAFSGCESLKKVTLPNTLTTIGQGAFNNCKSLKRIYIPQSCTRIQTGVFVGCTDLEEIIVAPENNEYYSINNCLIKAKTKTLLSTCRQSVIPFDGSIVRIGNSAFNQRIDLLEVIVPDTVVSIGNGAFMDCDNIKSITLPDGLEVIGNSVFRGCDALSHINIPKTVTRIGHGVFSKCKSLREILLPQGLKHISEGMFYECNNLLNLDLPLGVTSIGQHVFQYCNNLETVTIPITVTSIGDSMFYDCFKLKSVCYGGTKRDWENIIKIAPEGEQWSIGNDHQWSGLNHRFPIKIQCIDGIIEY